MSSSRLHTPFHIFVALGFLVSILSTSLLYNRAEGVIATFAIVALVSLTFARAFIWNRQIAALFLIYILYACFTVFTGTNLLNHSFSDLSQAIEFASATVLTAVMGWVMLSYLERTNTNKYVFYIVVIFSVGIAFYSVLNDGRTYNLMGRYLTTLGYLPCMFSLLFLGTMSHSRKYDQYVAVVLNSCTLLIIVVGIGSRSQTVAILMAWIIAAILFTHPFKVKLKYFGIPIILCAVVLILNQSSLKSSVLKRFENILEMVSLSPIPKVAPIQTQQSVSAEKPKSAKRQGKQQGLVEVKTSNTAANKSKKPAKIEPLTSDDSVNIRISLLRAASSILRDGIWFGNGNAAETKIIQENVGKFANFHNQYVSFTIAGGLGYLLIGIGFILAPFLVLMKTGNSQAKKASIVLSAFLLTLMLFTSQYSLLGFQNIHLLYSLICFSVLTQKMDLTS